MKQRNWWLALGTTSLVTAIIAPGCSSSSGSGTAGTDGGARDGGKSSRSGHSSSVTSGRRGSSGTGSPGGSASGGTTASSSGSTGAASSSRANGSRDGGTRPVSDAARDGALSAPDAAARNCFAVPSACGYPDRTNTGAPANTQFVNLSGTIRIGVYGNNVATIDGTPLTAAQGVSTTTVNGQAYFTLSGINLEGGIDVEQEYVRVVDSVITGGSNSNPMGTFLIGVRAGHFLIQDSTVKGDNAGCDPTDSQDQGCDAGSASTTSEGVTIMVDDTSCEAERVQSYWLDAGWHGPGTVRDSYFLDNAFITAEHYEPIYISDTTLVVDHSTLFNIHPQTAAVFVDTGGGGSGPGDSQLTITNSFLAGGGYVLYPAGNASSVGTGTMNITGNRFARCLTTPVASAGGGTACSGGQDSHGYWPNGGYFGIAAYLYCPPTSGQIWSGNYWDDDGSTVDCP